MSVDPKVVRNKPAAFQERRADLRAYGRRVFKYRRSMSQKQSEGGKVSEIKSEM